YHEAPAAGYFEPLYGIFNYNSVSWNNLQPGGDGFVTLVHEVGHGLGLAHPHDGGNHSDATVFPGVTSPFGDYGDYGLNQGIWTTMSYNPGWPSEFPSHTNLSYGWQATPMALDIAAIQTLYGPNTTTALGDNVYTLPTVNSTG